MDLVSLGKLGRARGLKGGILFWPHNPASDTLEPGMKVFVGDREMVLEDLREVKGGLELFFEEVTTPEHAKLLTHAEVRVPRDRLPALDAGEWYVRDLLNLAVKDEAGELLGDVVGTVDGGAQLLLEVQKPSGSRVLVPAVSEFLRGVVPGSHITIRPIPGMFDEPSEPA
jgi:16S rRNA processing protein RimM